MERLQGRRRRPRGNFNPRLQFREIPDLDLSLTRGGNLRIRGSHLHYLFVEKCREQEELRVAKAKPFPSFRETAFAQQDALLAPPQRFADQRPFLETDALHFSRAKLASRRWPSTSTSIRTLFSPATGFRVRRRTSPRPVRKACTASPLPITTPATPSLISSRKASCARMASPSTVSS